MKRPIIYSGVSVIISLVFAVAFHTAVVPAAAVCFILALLCIIIGFWVPNVRILKVCSISACIALSLYAAAVNFYVEPLIDKYDGRTVEFSGIITSDPETKNGNISFIIRTSEIDGEKKRVNIYFTTSYNAYAGIYDSISGKAELKGIFDYGYGYQSYYAARGIFLSTYVNPYFNGDYKVEKNDNRPFSAVFSDIQHALSSQFKKYLPEAEASVCSAIVTGDKSSLRDEVYDPFELLGISHVLVVSGMHLSIVAGAVLRLSENIPCAKRKKTVRAGIVLSQIFVITAFAAMTGFGFSVKRAWIMSLCIILIEPYKDIILGEDADSLVRALIYLSGFDLLGIAAILLCVNPFCVGDIGMLWSFSCTLSIMCLENKVETLIRKCFPRMSYYVSLPVVLFSTAAAALVGSFPFMILVTGSFSPFTVIVNILVVPVIGVIMIFGGLISVISLLGFEEINRVLMEWFCWLPKYLIYITQTFTKIPYSSVSTESEYIYVWFIFSVVLFAAYLIGRYKYVSSAKKISMKFVESGYVKKHIPMVLRKRAAVMIAISLSFLFAGYFVNLFIGAGSVTVSVLDVGNGIAVTVKADEKIALLNSYGEKYQYSTIKNELENFEAINILVDAPSGKPEFNYNRRICSDFNVKRVFVFDDKMYNEKYCYQRYRGKEVVKMEPNFSFSFFGGQEIYLKNCDGGSWELLNINGREILICPDDADFLSVPEEFCGADIVVMTDIPENFDYNRQSEIIVSSYGEECDRTVLRLKNDGYDVYATDGSGRLDIEVTKNGALKITREYTGGVTRYADN